MLLQILLWICGLILAVVVATVIGLRVPAVQQFAAERVTQFLAAKLNTRVAIGRFTTDWENSVVLKDFYLEDRNHDTLVYAKRLGLDLNLMALTRSRLKVRSVSLEKGIVSIYSTGQDRTFNYQFIREAFQTPEPAGSGTFVYRVGAVTLKHCRLRYADSAGGDFLNASIGLLKADPEKFNSEDLVFDLGQVKLEQSFGHYTRTKLHLGPGGGPSHKIAFQDLKCKKVNLNYHYVPIRQRLYLNIGEVKISAKETDLQQKLLHLKSAEIDRTAFFWYRDKNGEPGGKVSVGKQAKEQNTKAIKKAAPAKLPWDLAVDKLTISRVAFILSDQNMPEKPAGLDTRHLKITGFKADIRNGIFKKDRMEATIKDLAFQEQSGLELQKLKGKVAVLPRKASLEDLVLQTGNGRFKGAINLHYPALAALGKDLQKLTFSAKIRQLNMPWKDLFMLVPAIKKQAMLQKLGARPLMLSGEFAGSVAALQFNNVQLKMLTGTQVNASGKLFNAGTPQPLRYDVDVKKLKTNPADLKQFMAAGPLKVNLPEQISLSGKFRGSAAALNVQDLKLDAGGTELAGSGNITRLNQPNRHLDVRITKLQTGREAVLKILPAGTVSPEINLPDRITVAGNYKGTSTADFAANANLQTSFGNIQTKIIVRPVQQFSGTIRVQDFEAGKLLKQDRTLGKATGDANFNGKGFKLKTMDLAFDARIKHIQYRKENYHNLRVDGSLNQDVYKMHGNLSNVVVQELGHKLKIVKKANPVKLPGKIKRKLGFGKKKKDKEKEKE